MSKDNAAHEEIEKHREHIDEIDRELVTLLNKRAGHSLVIRGLKPYAGMGLYDAKREEEILQKVCSYNEGPLYNENDSKLLGWRRLALGGSACSKPPS